MRYKRGKTPCVPLLFFYIFALYSYFSQSEITGMKRLTLSIFILLGFILSILPSCEGLEENYSSNPTYRLSFSTDTLAFDTIFSTVGSTTRQFMIYNKHDEPLNIESILLAGGEVTGFRMNLDGRKGSSFQNVGILDKDSMYVFVEVTVNPTGKNQPLLIQDSVVFTVNGIRQSVLLEAYGQDVHLYKGGVTLAENTTLKADRPYMIYDSLTIAPNTTVTIEEGATFYMHDKAKMVVHGSMKALGSQEKPILFRGDRLDFILDKVLPYDHTPGQWKGIRFKSTSFGNEWNHVIVRNGTSGVYFEPSTVDQSKIKINNSQITNMGKNALIAVNADITAINSEFSNAGGNVLTLAGGKYYFAHCTVTNYMSLTKREMTSRSLCLLDDITIGEEGPFSLSQATFDNCIIDGGNTAGDLESWAGEIEIPSFSEDKKGNFLFNHCLLKVKAYEDDRFREVAFIKKSLTYLKMGEKNNQYAYDFHLDSASVVDLIQPDLEITKKYPIDRCGVDRLKNPNGPTIGAYEYVPIEEEETE